MRQGGSVVGLGVLLVAHLLLGIGLLVGNGTTAGLPFALVSTAMLVVALARGSRSLPPLLPWIIGISGVLVLTRSPAAGTLRGLLVPLTLLQTAFGIAVYLRPNFTGRWAVAIALGVYALAGASVITRSPEPRVDVFELQQDGARAFEAGHDPYASVVPNPYTKEETRLFFGDDRTELREYPYPPMSLLVTTLGHWLGGDVRWTLVAAQIGIAWLLVALARGAGHDARVSHAIATVHLLHPRGLFMLEQAWTDSLLACVFLLLLLVLQRQRTRWFGIVLGLFVATKQYSVIALALIVRDGRIRRSAWFEALAVVAAVTLPFFLWSPVDFVGDVVLFQLRQPFRDDALSVPAIVAAVTGWRAPGALAVVAAAAATSYAWPRLGPRADPSQLPLAAAVVFASFFLFAKQAFCNYYYFVGVLILAAAALLPTAEETRASRPRALGFSSPSGGDASG
jgi:hypothetical protein